MDEETDKKTEEATEAKTETTPPKETLCNFFTL